MSLRRKRIIGPSLSYSVVQPAIAVEDAQTTAWVAAVATAGGTVSAPRRAIVDALIVGLRNDGLLAVLDRLWLLAAENIQQATVDVVGLQSWTGVSAPTFTADTGYTADGTGYLNTNFTPSTAGGHYSSSSCSFGVYHINNRTTGQTASSIGTIQNSELRYSTFEPKETSPLCVYEINGATFGTSAAITTIRHSFVCSRTSSTDTALYLDDNTTPYISTTGSNTFGLSDFPFFIMSSNLEGASQHPSVADVFGAAFIGGGMNATQSTNLSKRINTYIGAIGLTPIF
jgi:hypothetical protein